MTNKKNRTWSKEDKLRILNMNLNEGIALSAIAREEKISAGLLTTWLKKYLEHGEEALENKKRPGNPLVKYSRRKVLTSSEQLEYDNLKLRIENELLKKGLVTKGDGSIVKYMK